MDAIFLYWILLSGVSYFSCRLYARFATDFAMVATVNLRSAHDAPTPTGAGIVVCILFALMLVLDVLRNDELSTLALACLAPLSLGLLGYLDDRFDIDSIIRAPIFIGAAAWCVYWSDLPYISLLGLDLDTFPVLVAVLMVLVLFWIQNLYNFMDGIDGLAAAQAVFVCLAATLIMGGLDSQFASLLLVIAALSLGFLFVNWPKASVFMGDAGSGFFGLMFGIFILSGELSIWVWFILLAQFLSDSTLTLFKRLIRGEKVYLAHSNHAYQHLNRRIGTQSTLIISIALNIIWVLPMAYWANEFPRMAIYIFVVVMTPLLVKDYLLGAGKEALS